MSGVSANLAFQIGGVSPSKIAQSRVAKSGLDVGWADFRRIVSYRTMTPAGSTPEVFERHTGQSRPEFGSLPASWPRVIAGLRKRASDNCGPVLKRGVNAARDIIRSGQDAIAGGAHV